MADGGGLVGRTASVRTVQALYEKAAELGRRSAQGHLRFKIRSGEHVVAACISVCSEAFVAGTDTDGGADLLLERHAGPASVEVKSVHDRWRKFEAESEVGASFETTVRSVGDIWPEIEKAFGLAVGQHLSKETPDRRVAAAFCFGLEHLTPEMGSDSVFAAFEEFPRPACAAGADEFWIIWHPVGVWSWTHEDGTWLTHLFLDLDGNVLLEFPLVGVEPRFFGAAGSDPGESPYHDAVHSVFGRRQSE